MPLKIIVEEEYGYKYWLWTVDKTFNDVYSVLKKAISEDFYSGQPGLPVQFNFGIWKEIGLEEYKKYTMGDKIKEVSAYACLHTQHDSWIEEQENR